MFRHSRQDRIRARPFARCRRSLAVRVAVTRWLLAALIALVGACAIPVSYHDATTYRNLTDLKADMMTLVESFDTTPYARSEPRIDQLRLALRKAHEYELGKGEPNSDTVKQFNAIRKLFEETVDEHRDSRPGELGRKYFQETAKVIGQAFNIAIATENAKNAARR